MLHFKGRFLFLLLCACLFAISSPLHAADDDAPVSYTVKPGDTLIAFAEQYLVNISAYRTIQRENGIRNPRYLPVGKTLQIRRSLLKYKPAEARILSVRGNVSVSRAGQTISAKNGQIISEGSRLSTAGSSFVTLGLMDGSRISLPSNSEVVVRRLRNFTLGGSLDYDFDIVRGGTRSKVVPHKSRDDRYRVRTPKAVSAVRGTDFQTRYDISSDRDFAEVVDGKLAVDTGKDTEAELPAGQGLALLPDGTATRENLLPEPKMIEPGKLQANPKLRFEATPQNGESGYRFTWATDAGFVDQLADIVTDENFAELDGIENGNYFIRAYAIAPSGIQGQPVTFAFKRRLNGVNASAGSGDDGYSFKWFSEGEGKRSFHFQLFRNAANGLAIVDETGLEKDKVTISDLPPGDYYWRVGAVQYLDGEVSTNWTSFEKLSVAP